MAWFDWLSPLAATQGLISGRIGGNKQQGNQQRGNQAGGITPPGWAPQQQGGMMGQSGLSSLGGSNQGGGFNQGGSGYGLAQGPEEDWFWGQPAHVLQTPLFANEQGSGFQQALRQALQGLSQNNSNFGDIANQARANFNEQTIPSIAERFTSLGAGNGRSSAFGNQLGSAAANFETGLAGQQSQHNMQQFQQLLQLLGIGLTPQFENTYSAGKEGFGQQALQQLIGQAGQAAKFLI